MDQTIINIDVDMDDVNDVEDLELDFVDMLQVIE